MTRDALTIAVIFGDDIPMFEASVPARVFGGGHEHPDVPPFTVLAVAGEPAPLTSTAGVRLDPPYGLADLDAAGTVIVPGWRSPGQGRRPSAPLLEALRRAHDGGATVVGLCLGAFVLAAAGLLDGRRATTHWHHAARLAQDHPEVDVDPDVLYIDEGRVLTSAGSAAGIDACLHLLRREHGEAAASAVARALVVAPHRAGGQAQYIDRPVPSRATGDALAAVVDFALGHLGDAGLDVDAMAARAHMSRRTFDRRFRAHLGSSPLQWLLAQRVLRARQLLESSDLGVDAVARRVGFADGVALRPHFRRVLGVPPQAYRESFAARPVPARVKAGTG